MTTNELNKHWYSLKEILGQLTGKEPKDLNAVLFIIGVQELGKGGLHFSKEEKQDLMHIATCTVLSYSDYFRLDYVDEDGWPHFEQLKNVPNLELKDQTALLKEHIILYAKDKNLIA